MKKFKVIVVFLLISTFTIGIYGCGIKSPTNTVKDYLEEIKEGENGDFSNLVNKTLSSNKENTVKETTKDETNKKLIDSMKKMTYTINSEKTNGNNATVNVKINGPDVESVIVDFMQKAITMSLTQGLSENKPNNEETDKLYENLFANCMNNVKYTDRTGDISLTKTDGKWKINSTDSLAKLLMNIDSALLNSKTDASKTNSNQIKEMTLNTPFNVDTEIGRYNLTIEGATLTDKRNEFTDKKVNKVVILNYSYTNESFGKNDGTDLYIDENAFQVLDDEGNVLDTYPVYDDNRKAQNTPVGGKSKGSIAYGLTTDSKNLNVTFIRGNNKVSKITIPIK
ncbi:DUF4878 domain-containing protein [Clostridium sp. JN-9]|uniref:DUF4878 domain-containing protein n=1 Tax=Clostridium sp. JN-9 TaxID=2507159 RepID=UPI000FFE0C7F|nr:DUF4878 domain-containing protein [Clostridium sp. JN-9]QAT39847.1 DUF4878 domain-containing protein [Clostridium sp. JN-9]